MNLEQAQLEIERLRAENEGLRRQVQELTQTVSELRLRIEELSRKKARQAAPFRKDDEQKVPPQDKKRSGRKKGHQGSHRPRPPQVDREEEVPLPDCPHCHGPVSDRTPLTQIIEELPPVRPIVTRVITWEGTCLTCGRVHSSHPLQTSRAGGAAGVQLGPRAAALGVYLKHALGIPFRKISRLLKDAFGLAFSSGGIVQRLQRMAQELRGRYDALVEQIRGSPTVYADETSWYVGEPKWWLWAFTNPLVTVYHVAPSRGGPVAERILGREFAGVLVTDCFTAYDRFRCPQHKCVAHHLRVLAENREFNPTPLSPYLDAWVTPWQEVTKLTPQRGELSAEVFAERTAALEARADALLTEEVTEAGDRKFRTRMSRSRAHLFGCLKYAEVEATNNRAERAIRPAVVARKISCGNKTKRGALTWQILTSLAVTAEQQGRDLLTEFTLGATPAPALPAG